jgi:hypothetical protein
LSHQYLIKIFLITVRLAMDTMKRSQRYRQATPGFGNPENSFSHRLLDSRQFSSMGARSRISPSARQSDPLTPVAIKYRTVDLKQ